MHISFSATDSFSVIERAEYSIDAENWQFVAPVGEISDSTTENYDFSVPLPAPSEPAGESPSTSARRRGHRAAPANSPAVALGGAEEHIVIVRVYDRADNAATAKLVVRSGQ